VPLVVWTPATDLAVASSPNKSGAVIDALDQLGHRVRAVPDHRREHRQDPERTGRAGNPEFLAKP
jgi:hypothetical protein